MKFLMYHYANFLPCSIINFASLLYHDRAEYTVAEIPLKELRNYCRSITVHTVILVFKIDFIFKFEFSC